MGGKQSKRNGGGEGKNNDGNLTVVLKSDFHCGGCDGCVTKVVKAIRSVGGVEKVTYDADSKKLTVIGKVYPVTLREEVEQKTQKHVELISLVPDGGGQKAGKGKELRRVLRQFEGTSMSPSNEPPITTTVLKVHLHRQDIQKIQEIVTKFKGYKEMKVDMQKDLVTVTGSMDVKDLVETLKKHLKEVEIVP